MVKEPKFGEGDPVRYGRQQFTVSKAYARAQVLTRRQSAPFVPVEERGTSDRVSFFYDLESEQGNRPKVPEGDLTECL